MPGTLRLVSRLLFVPLVLVVAASPAKGNIPWHAGWTVGW